MTICACGCGETIEPMPHHKYKPPKYKAGHWQRSGHRAGKRVAGSKWVRVPDEGTTCACGCGVFISPRYADGKPRYDRTGRGEFFVKGHQEYASGERSGHWRGGRYVHNGYMHVRMRGHHLADKNGYVREHRLVWEQSNGRRLEPWEHVHHVNGDKLDNRPENLVATTNAEHQRAHGKNPNAMSTTEQRRAAGRKGAEARWGKPKHDTEPPK